MKKVGFVSLGCPKNLVDSEMMIGSLEKNRYEFTSDLTQAEVIIVNTCGFIDDAKKESIAALLDAIDFKKSGKLKKLVATGCLVQRYKDELLKEFPEVDLFIGTGEINRLHEILERSYSGDIKKDYYHLPTYLQQPNQPRKNSEPFYRAYVKISEGCLKRCSFCVIPKIRGNLQSRPINEIEDEVRMLVDQGVREINIISHDFSDYGWDLRKQKQSLDSPVLLLDRLSQISDLKWIRVLYLYPDGVTQELIDLIKERPNLLPYFDIPLQHINDRILKSMNRKMKRVEIEERLKQIRKSLPDACIRTQFIVGFPGETEEEFNELLSFIKEQRFDRVGCFEFSAEETTPAGEMTHQIDDEIKRSRFERVMTVQQKISKKKHQKSIGKKLNVLVDGYSQESDLLLEGRAWFQAPEIDGVTLINEGQCEIGDFVDVEITASFEYDFIGRINTTS